MAPAAAVGLLPPAKEAAKEGTKEVTKEGTKEMSGLRWPPAPAPASQPGMLSRSFVRWGAPP
jgi:hypothetical protein